MFSKEFLFTAPFLLLLMDWLVMGTPLKNAARRIWPYACCLPIIPTLILFTAWAQNHGQASLSAAFNITNGAGYPQYQYALTQLSVVLTYLRLIFIPRGLNLDWDYPLTTSLLDTPALLSVALIAGILGGLAYWYRRYGQDVRQALLGYGVLWFFMTVAIDSSIIPLPDLLAEHRSYLPSIGILCALACGADLLRTTFNQRRKASYIIPTLMGVWILGLATATQMRHQVWHSRISIWKDAAAKSPHKFRPLLNLGTSYFEHGQPQEAAACIRKAIPLLPQCFVAYRNLGCVENSLGRHREALEALRIGLGLAPDDYEQLMELGKAYAGLGDLPQSAAAFKKVISLRPAHRPAYLALGAVYIKQQQFDQALEQMKLAHGLQPLEPPQRQLFDHIAQLAAQRRQQAP
jgi:tetratricopeptide (TPR) repeat protein